MWKLVGLMCVVVMCAYVARIGWELAQEGES